MSRGPWWVVGMSSGAAPSHGEIRKVAFASFIGTAIEWYDFFLYGTAASLVFPALFFPDFSETAGTLLALSTYAVGFVARPVGGIVFGHYGDRIGRKSMLVLSLLIMGVATALIGFLPTFAQIGVLAPLLLVTLRFAQGFTYRAMPYGHGELTRGDLRAGMDAMHPR